MREFGLWLRERPLRLVELCGGALLLVAAALASEDLASTVFLYSFGALLLVLTLHSYLGQNRPRR
ncbi:MAG: hypothetical protein AVDCRST_MAG25-2776 [uncultured Rubrobacteraceae bacterium]|uniref:Uncharacterized protein n=1 Tax=uncultured Rubrobacteraceae bacterium TaxID=349277 RepID=A0A6J4RZC0_9ACTN|nr:MAG: hypothetical protein AVDCRST_MAG25-2776 [uncultured Rubrobacteraceae bacterium]